MAEQSVEDIVYRTVDGIELLGRLYRPASAEAGEPFVIDAHGGAWDSGDRLNNAVIHEHLVAHGIGVFALDFRSSAQAKFPAPVQDVNYGVRWFKKNAAHLDLTPGRIGGLGSSSGAQQMGLVALTPNDPMNCVADPALSDVDASLTFFVACWPILDPLARYRMAQEAGNERLVAAHDAYFPDEAAMEIGNPYMLLDRNEATHFPPMLVIQGTADANVDHTRADIFAHQYREASGIIDVHKFEGQPHTFLTNDPESAASKDAIAKIREFILYQVA